MKGDSTFNSEGEFGIKGVSDSANTPPALIFPCSWKDYDGNFWIFGGIDVTDGSQYVNNALWRFNPLTNEWTWVTGNTGIGVYGIQGVPDSNNLPPTRNAGMTWVDSAGYL